MTTSNPLHESDPGTSPEVQFQDKDLQYIVNFTDALRQGYFIYGNDPALFEESTEATLQSDVGRVAESGAEALSLVIVAEGLGATRDQAMAQYLLGYLEHNPLLSHEDYGIISDSYQTAWAMRLQGIPKDEVAQAIAGQASVNLTYIQGSETNGPDRSALKVGLLGFLAGATLANPDLQASEQLIQEVYKHRMPSPEVE